MEKEELIRLIESNGIEKYGIADDCSSVIFLEDVSLRNIDMRKAIHDNNGILPFKILKSKSIDLHRTGLKSMHNLPSMVDGDLNISYNQIAIFMSVKAVTGNFDASYNKFTSVLDIPFVEESIILAGNAIGNIVGLQPKINGSLDISNNRIKTLFADLEVRDTFNASNNVLILEPIVKGAKSIIYENNPCNPSDNFSENLW